VNPLTPNRPYQAKEGEKRMDLVEIRLDENEMLKAVEDAVEKECPEEVGFVDSLDQVGVYDGPWSKVQAVMGASMKKAFEMGS
jgi:hypothetical protein